MRNTLIPHIPGFVDCDPIPEEEFDTIEQLLKTNWVKKFKGHALALSDDDLIGVTENGNHWWVIGRFKNTHGINSLPKWEPKTMPSPIIMA